METLSFLRSLVADENVSLEICSRIHLIIKLQVIRSLHLNFTILSCLSPAEATELLERIRCGSPYLNQVYAWDEYFMQSLETSTSQQCNRTSVNGITSGVGATIPSLGTATNGLYLHYFYMIMNVLLNLKHTQKFHPRP